MWQNYEGSDYVRLPRRFGNFDAMATTHITKRGFDLLRDPRENRGTVFTHQERIDLGIVGLLPPVISPPELQMSRAEMHLDTLPTDLDRYVYFSDLQDRNEALFYRVLMHDPVKYMPIVYTPTVGLACQQYGRIYRRPKGLWITADHRGMIRDVLRNWPERDVRFIVVTDGERILGLGDQGAQGMGISIGKLALYTACAGIPPSMTLPITLDVGTANETLLEDPFYIGTRIERLKGEPYDSFIDEFVEAVQEVFPHACIQWEDFANHHAVPVLDRYREQVCSFNDDIQGTAAVGVAGVLSAVRFKGERVSDQRFMFFGAGSAGIGIAELMSLVMVEEGLTIEEAHSRCWLVDSQGLVTSHRQELAETKRPFAHDHAPIDSFEEAVRTVKPTVLIGTSTIHNAFTPTILRTMAQNTARPIVFPYSNPTSKSECSAQDAYDNTDGTVIFASGSPFPPVEWKGHTYIPSQGNNVYIFPAIGMAVLATRPRIIPEQAFVVAARALSELVTQEEFDRGLVYPPLAKIRETSLIVAERVAEYFFDSGIAHAHKPASVHALIQQLSWHPPY